MSESVPLRCPVCRREHLYAAPTYPCACGAPVSPPLEPGAGARAVVHQVWEETWVTVACTLCGRLAEWPHPELGCACGTVLRIPVAAARARPGTQTTTDAGSAAPTGTTEAAEGTTSADGTAPAEGTASAGTPAAAERATPAEATAPAKKATSAEASAPAGTTGSAQASASARTTGSTQPPATAPTNPSTPTENTPPPPPRRPFQPIAIRTARDAVTVAALYLRWLGYQDIRRADQRPPSGIGLAARGLLAQVDPTVRPASLRDVECLWLTAMTESAHCVYFSLAGYTTEARARADALGVPLFVLDLTGTPQPMNSPADELGDP
ncbi:hypothetical protein ACFXPN_22985 [Streptomyces griseorubiginosus]|uniref:hypothetical protein n=1 Tax=Streptomyces griseorubiginosus TaxID=67304 RepID=UPI0036ACA558